MQNNAPSNPIDPVEDSDGAFLVAPAAAQPAIIADESRRELRERVLSGSAMLRNIQYPIVDWSSSGICMHEYDGDHSVGDRAHAWVHIECAESVFTFKCELLLIRLDTVQQQLAGVFVSLARPDRVAIAAHFEALESAAEPVSRPEPSDPLDIGAIAS